MSYKDYLKLEKMPTVWCAGCGLGILLQTTAKAFDSLQLDKSKTTVVSGIGCTARGSGYFNLDSVNGIHGRAVAIAEGIKRARDDMNVIVFSGDGDITGIGGNHLLHCSRRNTNITVICANNEIYGMTGGQKSPLTPKGVPTMTSPEGNRFEPVNIQGIIAANKKHFYARTTVWHVEHMKRCIEEAIKCPGFSFVEIRVNCISNYGRRIGFKTPFEMLKNFRDTFKVNNNPAGLLKDNELGIVKND
ncbi:2-oxoacid:ferredoxin oxidoreductase subunit beta [Candidatus Woesearchaeota archaeon]|nr:2-oxoacid:ferredoxin oxidoreductase subunit beta [Candidatus Woesearchaeota archaeon]MBW3022361.1 2-oxoacid:ferredoxin oxidoreductase subunit beta [Candidatus Woesearchaeota archaeon]